MKTRLLLAVALTFICLNVKAQTYYPFQTDSATWTVVEYGYGTIPPEIGVSHFGLSGDTIVNGNTYTKIYINHGGLGFVNPESAFNLQTAEFYGGFREDPTHKVWFFGSDAIEYLYYDFSLNLGDIFCFNDEPCGILCHPVSLVDSILIDGNYRKQIHFSYGGQEEIWIEGIGSVYDNWIGNWCFIGNIAWELNCYSEHGVHKYGTCDYPNSGINEISNDTSPIKIFPNPVSDFLIIENGVSGETISIDNVLGQNVLTQKNISGKLKLNLEFLPKGIYVVKITSADKHLIKSDKLIKQ